jgi:hypothetical protein
MSDWLLGLPVREMAALILGATYLATAGIYLVVTKLATGERAKAFKAISPGVLPPLAIVFALLVGRARSGASCCSAPRSPARPKRSAGT